MRFMSLPSVASKLKDIQEKDEEWQSNKSYTDPLFATNCVPHSTNKGKRKLDNIKESNQTSEKPNKRACAAKAKQTPATPKLDLGQSRTFSGAGATSDGSSAGSSAHSHSLRMRKKALCDANEEVTTDSADESGSDHTATCP